MKPKSQYDFSPEKNTEYCTRKNICNFISNISVANEVKYSFNVMYMKEIVKANVKSATEKL